MKRAVRKAHKQVRAAKIATLRAELLELRAALADYQIELRTLKARVHEIRGHEICD